MSTWIYLVCEDHDPPILADGESGQHLYDLDDIRADLANRESIAEMFLNGWSHPNHFRRNTAHFLSRHRLCTISIQDEYGVKHPISEDK